MTHQKDIKYQYESIKVRTVISQVSNLDRLSVYNTRNKRQLPDISNDLHSLPFLKDVFRISRKKISILYTSQKWLMSSKTSYVYYQAKNLCSIVAFSLYRHCNCNYSVQYSKRTSIYYRGVIFTRICIFGSLRGYEIPRNRHTLNT